jgi:hypothetical protein
MKRIVGAILLLLATTVCVGADHPPVAYNSSWSIYQLSHSESIPVKSLATGLGLTLDEASDRSLADLGITRERAADAIHEYRESEVSMVGSIVAVGMMIVFASLVVVAILIGLFRHLHIFDRDRSVPRARSVKSVIGTITSQGDLSEQSIAAVVTAVFLHEEQVDAENRLLLTWKRASGSAWRTGGFMPNSTYFAAKRGR